MNTALASLVQVSTFTGLLWMPYVLNRMIVRGIPATVGYPIDPEPLARWAQRLRSAHANAVENLAHAVTYTFRVPWLRTLAFLGGFAAQMMVAWELLSA